MKKTGEILRARRIKQGRALDEVAQEIKVREEFLRAIEASHYEELPDPVYARGFIRNYATALGLDAEKEVMPFYRREMKEDTAKTPGSPPQPIDKPRFNVTPGVVISAVVTVAIILFLVTLFWQYRSFAGIPVLIVQQPPMDLVTARSFVEVQGRTDPGAEVTINGQTAMVDSEGRFRLHVSLELGLNRIEIRAVNQLGKETTEERIVTVKTED